MARKGKGRLETSVADGTTDVGALPVELFDQIAEALARKAYVDAHEDLKRRYHEDDDWGAWEQKLSGVEQDVVSFSNFLDHGVVYDEFVYEGGVPHFVNEHEAVVVDLLKHFGLCLASSHLLTTEEDAYLDLNATWTVALPLVRSKSKSFPELRIEASHELGPAHSLFRISPSVFTLPANAYTRFRRLFASFPAVSPTSLATDTIRIASEAAAAPAAETETTKGKNPKKQKTGSALSGEERKAAREPRWMLVCTGSTCS